MSTLHIVHCIDTEGPLSESLTDTFERVKSVFGIDLPASIENLQKLQRQEIPFDGQEGALAQMLDPALLKYNNSWEDIRAMLLDLMSDGFRRRQVDDFGNGWVYSWHCMDHMHYSVNPRHKDVGYGNVFRFYRDIIKETGSDQDEINWHFHPRSITGNPLHAATSYLNSYPVLLEILCRRILEDGWFPTVNRPGFHSERPDSHAFLEQWIPYDYANQVHEAIGDQPDLINGRFGDWRRAPLSWRGYHPAFDDYQQEGTCKRTIFRCLNVGTRFRSLEETHVIEAFQESESSGCSVLAFANHDYRDIRVDVEEVRSLINKVRPNFQKVKIRYSGAQAAARAVQNVESVPAPVLKLEIQDDRLIVNLVSGEIFGPQPFLAIMDKSGKVYHDNFDFQVPGQSWTYTFDEQTLPLDALKKIGVASAGRYGHYTCQRFDV
tara:strand:+ start:340 stop:1644 length:1305 start_codon:yes stop_codon:yes gene_type:complete